jgi:hypothetical protein
MVGYVNNNDPVFGIVTDYVNESLTQFVRELAQEYTNLPVKNTKRLWLQVRPTPPCF